MSFLNENLQLVVVTSPAPWHPSMRLIERMLGSTWEMLGEELRPTFYCDHPAPWVQDEGAYWKHVRLLGDIGDVHVQDEWVGLAGQYARIIEGLEKPLVLNMQHDWEFVEPKRVQIGRLVHLMLNVASGVQMVRFHKRKLPQSKRKQSTDWRYSELDPRDYNGVPLIRTNGWGCPPHIATLQHYHEKVLPNMDRSRFEARYGRYGVEHQVRLAHTRDERTRGPDKSWADWGTCFYGRFGDERYVRHLGHKSKKWRRVLAQ